MNWQDTAALSIRVGIVYITLLVLTRMLGKKQMSQLTFFNYVTGITIGSLAGSAVITNDEPFWDKFIALVFWCFLTFITGIISLKSGRIRRIIDGQPAIVIKRGAIMREVLRKNNVNMDDLTTLLRKQNVFSVTEVEYAILEPDGVLSVLKKAAEQAAKRADVNVLPPEPDYLPCEIIADGRVIPHNLLEMGLDEDWLVEQLKSRKIKSAEDVFYAELTSNGGLYVERK